MDVKEAAKKAAAYTADIETVMNPKSLSEFLSKSGFTNQINAFDARNHWEIGVGFVQDFDRGRIDATPSSSVWERTFKRLTFKRRYQ